MLSRKNNIESNKTPVKESKFVHRFSSNKGVTNKNEDQPISPVYISLGLIVVIVFPISGFIIFCVMKNRDKQSKAYEWAFRALTLASALCTIYVYIICSVYYSMKPYFKDDKLGYSFT